MNDFIKERIRTRLTEVLKAYVSQDTDDHSRSRMRYLQELLIGFVMNTPDWQLSHVTSYDHRDELLGRLYDAYIVGDIEVLGAYWGCEWDYKEKPDGPVFCDKKKWLEIRDERQLPFHISKVGDSVQYGSISLDLADELRNSDVEKNIFFKRHTLHKEAFRPWMMDYRVSRGDIGMGIKAEFVLGFTGDTEEDRLLKMVDFFRDDLIGQVVDYTLMMYENYIAEREAQACREYMSNMVGEHGGRFDIYAPGNMLCHVSSNFKKELSIVEHSVDDEITVTSTEIENDANAVPWWVHEEDCRKGDYKVSKFRIYQEIEKQKDK